MRVDLTVNGDRRQAEDVWEGESLLYLLRERLGLPGSKNACEQGECGSCSVYLDGEVVCACLVAAGQAVGREVVTVEGLADGAELHPVQQAFLDRDGFQCGYCTPGQICSAVGMLDEFDQGWPSAVTTGGQPAALDAGEVRERMSGNLCRCGAYMNIVPAILDVADAAAGRSSA